MKLTSVLNPIGRLLNTRARLSLCMAASVVSAVLVAQVLQIIPDYNQAAMHARKLQTETLALTGSAIAETGSDLKTFENALENACTRAEDLISIGLRTTDDKLAISVNNHGETWRKPASGKSNDRFMFVPVFRGKKQLATLELCYRPLVTSTSWITNPTAQLAGFLGLCVFLACSFLLYKTMKQLDPRGAVPKHVRDAFGRMAEGLLILDRSGRIMLANDTFGKLLAVDADQLTGKEASDFPWKTEQKLPWLEAMAQQRPVTERIVEIEVVDQKRRMFNVNASPVMGADGKSRGVMVTFDDITTLEQNKRDLVKARNAADEANEAKSRFLARMSHEIRTPMNAIIGYTDILQQGVLEHDDQVRYLTTIQSSGEHLLTLINDILDLSKVEAGQMTIERREISLISLMHQVVDTLNMKATEKDLALSMQVDGRVPEICETDETRLKQILINTIGNAIKFTQAGSVRLVARTAEVSSRTMLQFDIVDTGIGMSASALQSIFDPFTQADDSVTRRFGGTGLGLSISKQLSEALGGGISVTSEEGVGTTFTVTIDPGTLSPETNWITNDTLAVVKRPKPTTRPTVNRVTTGHVLVVDDTRANLDLAGLMLKRIGITCDFAVDGEQALEALATKRYDALLMDVNMPVMDGMTATRLIREAGLKLPVIAVTAIALEDEKQKCLDAGYNRLLLKPIRQESLIEVLSGYFDFTECEKMLQSPSAAHCQIGKTVETSIDLDSRVQDALSEILDDAREAVQASGHATRENELQLPAVVRTSLPDEPELLEIVADFVPRMKARMPEFEQAFADQATKELADLAHWLVGSAGTVGLDEFVAPAQELEHSDGTDPQRQAVLIRHLMDLCDRVEIPEIA